MVINTSEFRVKLLGIIFIFDALVFGLEFSFLIVIRFLLYAFLIFNLPKSGLIKLNWTIIIVLSLIFLFFILPFFSSSNLLVSLDSALKSSFSLFLYIYAFLHINSLEKMIKLSKYCFLSLIIVLICIGLSNLFKFGELNYRGTSLYFGASGVNYVKNLLLFGVLSTPYLVLKAKRHKKKIIFSVFFVGAVLVILSTKRSAMSVMVIYLLLLLYFKRKEFSKLILPIGLMTTIALFFFQEKFAERLEMRSNRFDVTNEETLGEEWRIRETEIVVNKFKAGDVWVKTFGNEIFNEVEGYNLPLMFHNDFAVLLGGTGLLGFSLYSLFLVRLFFWYRRHLMSSNYVGDQIFKWMYLSLLFGLILFGIAGNFKMFGSSLSISLAGLGAIQGMVMNRYKSQYFPS